MALQRLAWFLAAAGLQATIACAPAAPRDASLRRRVYVNEEYRYRLSVPVGWHVSVAPGGEPVVIFNYNPKAALPQGLIPEHGAEIYVVPFAAVEPVTGPVAPDQWIDLVDKRDRTNITVKRIASLYNSPDSPQDIVGVQADFKRSRQDDGLQRELSYYFRLRDAGFHLIMYFSESDQAHAPQWADAFLAVLRSMRALPGTTTR
jgi:hypothetical protein